MLSSASDRLQIELSLLFETQRPRKPQNDFSVASVASEKYKIHMKKSKDAESFVLSTFFITFATETKEERKTCES